ncbi:unnamed protein product [Camellia sinensis]
MGWEEVEGLGKEKQGIKEYVREAAEIKDEAVEKDDVQEPQGRYKKREGKLDHAYSSEDLGGILGRGLNSIPREMGVMSRQVLPICGKVCFFYPSLRPRSRQPVKRYKNLLANIFPRSQLTIPSGRQSSGAIARDNNGLLPIHLASIKGHVAVVRAFLQYWPDSRELLNCHGQNILHVAAKSRGHNMVSYILQAPELEKLYKHEGQAWKHTLAFGHHGLASKDC